MATNPIAKIKGFGSGNPIPSMEGRSGMPTNVIAKMKYFLKEAAPVDVVKDKRPFSQAFIKEHLPIVPIQIPLAPTRRWSVYSYLFSAIKNPVLWLFVVRKIVQYWRSYKTALINREVVVSNTQRIQDELSKIPPVLQRFLVLGKMNARLGTAQVNLQSQQIEVEEFRRQLEALTPDDVDRALDQLHGRLHTVLARHEGNLSLLVTAARNLQEAEQEVQEALEIKRKTAERLKALEERIRVATELLEKAKEV